MGGLTAWWPRLPGAGRAGVIAAAAFALTGAAAVGLTAAAHQAWVPVLASVLILVPGLYLAWKAVPSFTWRGRGQRAVGIAPSAAARFSGWLCSESEAVRR
jgi:hypothetical protein